MSKHVKCVHIKLCDKTGKAAIKTYPMMEMEFRDVRMTWAQDLEWFHHFEEGQISIESDTHPERLSTSRNKFIAEVHDFAWNDRRWLSVKQMKQHEFLMAHVKPL